MGKILFTSLLVIIHIGIVFCFCGASDEYRLIHSIDFKALYFGVSFWIMALIRIFRHKSDSRMQIEIYRFHTSFIALIGTVFYLHYKGIFIVDEFTPIWALSIGICILFIVVIFNAYRYRLYKKDKYL